MLSETTMALLQPIMLLEVSVPENHFGVVLSDLSNVRKGNIQSVTDGLNAKEKVISAEVPLRAIIGYSTTIRSLTQGTASYTMDFLKYGELSQQDLETLEKDFRGN